MKVRFIRLPLVVLLLGAALVLGLSACTSDNDGDDGDVPDEPGVAGESVEGVEQYIGLTKDEAGTLADSEGHPWRVGIEDGELQDLDADLVPGRVTFELEQGKVTGVEVEAELPGTGADQVDPAVVEDPDAAAIVAAAVNQILTVDHSFGVGEPPPFDDVRVANALGGTDGVPMAALQLETIAEVVQATGATVQFTEDPRATIEDLFDQNLPGVAVVTVGLEIGRGRAEVKMELWCGSLCGVYLTYEVVETNGVWTVTGPIGPIAIS